MSLLTSLFTGRWIPRRIRSKAGRWELFSARLGGGAPSTSLSRRGGHLGRPFEQLEPRLALAVTTIPREIIVEEYFPHNPAGDKDPVGEQPGQLVVAADQGSDVYLQKVDMTPEELLVADNGSFLDYMAIENVDGRFDEFIVTNGAEHLHEAAITADQWWLFPTKTNDNAVSPTDDPLSTANLTTTRLALDRPEVVIGPGRDFFGSVYYMQNDGTLTTWTFSAWDGSGNSSGDFVSQFGEALYITSGPGFGGGPISFKNTLIAPVQSLIPGHVFPRKISVVTEQLPENLQTGPGSTKQFGGRRHYLEIEWSQTPVTPPVMEANYWGASHYVAGVPQNVRDPLSTDEDVPPTVGIAMRTTDLRVTIPRAITEGSPDGSPSLGIIPGTTSGTLVIGGVGQEEIYRMTFEDRKNIFPEEDARNDEQNPVLNDRFTFFFDDYDNSGAVSARRTFGLIEGEIETNIIKDIDWRFREQAVRTHTYLEGEVVDASVLQFGIGSHVNDATRDLDRLNQLYGDNNLNDAFRALEGINVVISPANLLDGTARDAVRVEDLNYHVYVKPPVPNEVYFTAAADFTRAVTVDLLTEGSSVYVNSPIRVADPDGDIDLRATNVYVNAPLETDDYLILGRSNSEESPRLPRLSDPQGGELSTPTFLGSLLTDETTTRTVAPTPVLDGFGVGTLDVLPGREGYGYDPTNPPIVTIEAAPLLDATVKVAQVAGGVGELLLDDVGNVNTGIGVDGLEYLDIQFDPPQLRVVDSVNRWTRIQNVLTGEYDLVPAPEGYFAAPVIAISQPEIVASATRIGYGEVASVTPDNEWGNGVKSVDLRFGGRNYSARPTITLRRGDGQPFWDERVPVQYRSFPRFEYDFDLQIQAIVGQGGVQTGAQYVSGTVRSLRLLDSGFGLNIESDQDLVTNYFFEVTGGYNGNLTDNGFPVQRIPAADEIVHADVEIEEALLGTLAWKGSSVNDQVTPVITEDPLDPRLNFGPNGEPAEARLLSTLLNPGESYDGPMEEIDKLEDRGLHYELSPDVQFIGKLTADVPLEFRVDEDFDGDTGVSGDVIYGDQVVVDGGVTNVAAPGEEEREEQFYRASLENVFAFADGSENFPLAKGKFRDGDYLSYLNSRQKNVPNGSGGTATLLADKVVTAHASVDGQNWFRVVPVRADALENFYHPAKALQGSKEIVLREGFVNWHYLEPGMTITLPTTNQNGIGQKVKIVQWFENTRIIVVDKVIEEGFSETDDVGADDLAGLTPDEQPRGIRFGEDRNIIDVYRQQFSFRMVDYDTDEYYWPATGSKPAYTRQYAETVDEGLGLLTADDLAAIDPMDAKHFRIFMDPWFETASLDADGERTGIETGRVSGRVATELKAFASMGFDQARGRAVLSGEPGSRQITNLEVTHPGSGYIRTPAVQFGVNSDEGFLPAIPAGSAAARAIVSGGIYELAVTEAGFNYYGDVLPGLAAEVVRNVTIPVFDLEDLPAGARLPTADLLARNTSIRAGSIVDPGAGLKIIGSANSEELGGFDQGNLVIEPGEGLALDPAVFQAIVEPDGRILRFEKLRSGTGYRIAPVATVESPLPPRSATAYASINSSLGTVAKIEVLDEGHRYAVAPKVYVLPPTPRGEGRAATAVSVLGPSGEVMRIDITDPGSGYTAPPVVLIQEVDAYNVVENVDVAAHVSANKYEWYVSRNVWTDRERGEILLRPTNTIGYSPAGGGTTAEWVYIEAAATDITFEGNVDATDVTVLMNSRVEDQPFAPYELTTLSTATGTQSGTVVADQLVVTMGNDVPTPLSGGSLVNRVVLRTDVRTLRATAAVSQRNPRGAFPFDIQIDAVDNLLVEAVARSSGEIALNVPGDLEVKAGIFTDGDISITTTNFSQTTPLETEFGSISILAEDIDVLNSVLVKAAPLDERNADISLHATGGSIDLQGTVSSPNSIYLRQQGVGGQVGGNTRLRTQELRVEAEGSVDVFTDVDVAYGSSDFGDFSVNELNDVAVPTLQVPNGVIRLTANGVDRGGNATNPIALKARVVEGQELFVSAPNGSVDVDVDTSSDLSLGVNADLAAGNAAPMLAAGNVRIINASGAINVLDGPVAGQSATVVKAASTARLPDIHAYAANTPGEFPSELSGPGEFPYAAFGGVGSIKVGDFVLLKDQFDRPETGRFDESRENGVYEVMRLGGGNAGFQDWLLRRSVDADSRPDLLPGSYVRVREGTHRGEIFQVQYSILPALGVTRTINNQLVVDAGVGGLLAVDVNDVVTGYGIVPGARVTGVDYTNGVVTLGAGNGYEVTGVDENAGTVIISAEQSLLFESLRYAQARGEKALISGYWFRVGAEIRAWDEDSGQLTVQVPVDRQNNIWENGIALGTGSGQAPEGSRAIVGFSSASTDRVSLNPAVRSFLINSIEDEARYLVSATRTLSGVDDNADQQLDYTRVVNPATLARSRNTIDVVKSKLEGWAVRIGDEITYTITDRSGRKTDHINRVVGAIDGNATSQDEVANGLVRIGLAEPTLVPTYLGEGLGYELPDLTLRNRARVSAANPQTIDWESLHVGMTVEASGASDRTTYLTSDGYRLADGSAYRYDVDRSFQVYGRLEIGMPVTGESVPPGTALLGFDAEDGTVDLNSRLFDVEQPVTFGDRFTTLVDWDERENYLVFSDEIETTDFRVRMGFTVESFDIRDEVKVLSAGSGYSRDTGEKIEVFFDPPDVPVTRGGIQIEGYAVPDGDGGIKEVRISRQGAGYDATPNVYVALPSGVGSRATAEVILNKGSLYKNINPGPDDDPAVKGRFEFLATADIVSPGSGYSTNRDVQIGVTFSEPDRSVADGAVQMEGYAEPDGSGGISRIVITQAGFGYITAPLVTIAEPANPDGEAAEGRVLNFTPGGDKVLVSFSEPDAQAGGVRIRGYAVPDELGGIRQVVVTEPGSGYESPPTATIDASPYGGVRAQAKVSTGLGYSEDQEFRVGVKFSAPDTLTGVQMLGYAVPDGLGGIEKVVITQQGRGYAKTPTVIIEPPLNPSRELLGLRAAGVVEFSPTYIDEVILENLLGGDDSALSMTPNFTNYDGLRAGQPVFGEGVKPGTVITRVLPAVRRVEVTPGGLPVRVTVEDSPGTNGDEMEVRLTGSVFYTDGFEHLLQMPRSFNEFHALNVGQRVRFPNSEWADTVITAIDPVYRQIGIRPPEADVLESLVNGSIANPISISKVVFDSLDRVEFGMIDRTGTGTASFSVTPFGYEAITMATPAVASGLASLRRADENLGAYEIELTRIDDEQQLISGRRISGVGLRPGYRIENYDGRNLSLYSAELTFLETVGGQHRYQVDDAFSGWATLSDQMRVTGEGVASGTVLVAVEPANGVVTLSKMVPAGSKVVFGNPFTDKWLAQGVGSDATSGVSIHLEENRVSSLIAAGNIRDEVHYQVSTDGSTNRSAGSLGRIMLVAQRNEYHADDSIFAGGASTQPVVTFAEAIRRIELAEPLPAITTNAITVDGARADGGVVEVVGRFIHRTESGDNVLSTTEIDGFVVDGEAASGTILKNMRIGGFSNGSAIRVDGSSNAIITGMTVGVTGAQIRSASRFGVLVTGGATDTTIQDTEIVSAEQAGIRIDEGAAGTKVVGVTLGNDYGSRTNPDYFWNETGVEVVADDVQLGLEGLPWKSSGEHQGADGLPYEKAITVAATLTAGSQVAELSLTDELWADLVPGLAVIGVGLVESTFIRSIDTMNRRVVLSKPASRTVSAATVLIGYQAVGNVAKDELTLAAGVPIDRVFSGQSIRVVSGLNRDQIFESTIVRVDETNRRLYLADEVPHSGMYERGIHLVDFGSPGSNEIRYSRNGVIVGLFGRVSADRTRDPRLLTVAQGFTAWSSLEPGMKMVVRYAEGDLLETSVVEWDETTRTIRIANDVDRSFFLQPVRFEAADNFQMVNTTVAESIEDGIVLGGGERHTIGSASASTVFGTLQSTLNALNANEPDRQGFELASNKILTSISSLGDFRVSDLAVSEWLETAMQGRDVSVFGTGVPEGSTVQSFVNGIVTLDIPTASLGQLAENGSATVYFGLGVYVTAEPGAIRKGDRVDGEGDEVGGETRLYEFLSVEHIRNPVPESDLAGVTAGIAGFIALNSPRDGLLGVEGRGRLPAAGDRIVFVDRGLGNTVTNNAGFGISVIDGLATTALYDAIRTTWGIAGNSIDISYDRGSSFSTYAPNGRGPLSPLLFAQIFGDAETFSNFDRTDSYGNQYALEREITETNEPDDPFGGSGGGTGSSGDGSGGVGSGGGTADDPFDPGVAF